MPDGSLLYAQSVLVQTMNMVTGLRIAQTPPLPVQSFWEYGVSAAVHTLQMPVYVPGQAAPWSVDWVVFGGHWQATPVRPCRDFSLRTRLTINGSRHTFSPWQVETMPGEATLRAGAGMAPVRQHRGQQQGCQASWAWPDPWQERHKVD